MFKLEDVCAKIVMLFTKETLRNIWNTHSFTYLYICTYILYSQVKHDEISKIHNALLDVDLGSDTHVYII